MLKLNNYFHTKWLILAVTFTATVILCTHIPQEFMPSKLQKSGLDKFQHIVAYGIITFLFILSLKNSLSLFSMFLLFFFILNISIFDEVTQPLVNRQASLADVTADAIGVVMVLLFSIVRKRRRRKNNAE